LTIFGTWEHSATLYHIEESFASHNHPMIQVGTSIDDQVPATFPINARQISVDDQELLRRYQAAKFNEHGLGVFSTAMINDEESASAYQLGDFFWCAIIGH
jgi:hypothetical protein